MPIWTRTAKQHTSKITSQAFLHDHVGGVVVWTNGLDDASTIVKVTNIQ